MSGKHYNGISVDNDKASVKQDGTFTIQIVLDNNFIAAEGTPTVTMTDASDISTSLAGASLLLIDKSSVDNPVYYEHKVDVTADDIVNLNDFTKCGATNQFVMSNGAKTLLLIVDLAHTTSDIEVGSYTCTVAIPSNASGSVTTASFEIEVQQKGEAELSGAANSSYTMTNNIGRPASVKFVLKDAKGDYITFPRGAVLTCSSGNYNLSADGYYFLVPMVASSNTITNVQINTPYAQFEPGNYELVATGYISATSNPSAPLGGTEIDNPVKTPFTIAATVKNALKLQVAEGDRMFTQAKVQKGINLTIQRSEGFISGLTLKLQKKAGDSYTYSDVAGFTATNIAAGTNSITASATLQPGTYRFVLESDDKTAKTTLTFIVV